jgi:zona occludens toxin (predicted ATPase)
MARVEGNFVEIITIIGVPGTGGTSSAVARSFVTMLQEERHIVSNQKILNL